MGEIKAVIDIGTGSIKFHVAEKNGGTLKVLKDANNIARLGEGLKETGSIAPDALERNAVAVAEFADTARSLGAAEIVAVGTMALRTAKNAAAFIDRVKELAKVGVRVIPGDEEARLSYIAVMSGIDVGGKNLVTFDTGGGSTEFVYGRGETMLKKFSVSLGAVRLTEQFFNADPVAAGSVSEAEALIEKELAAGGVDGQTDFLVGMGGTVTSIASVKHKMAVYDPDVVQGSSLTAGDIAAQIRDYEGKTLEERKKIVGLQPKRADVILAGACIVRVIMKMLGVEKLTVSDRGLRHGLMYELMK
ncbi:MAG: Ppx/GppA family phosphatase [Synergistaceae bacterium]|jgi:exopolyphosphatase/guanosine-5'-triphosphate,3'-diphosphate pyrophosphatase|nr:Ppx/GppA family phosphatase [Synergistaceae bacterium]